MDAIENVNALLDVTQLMQKQLAEAIEIIKERDQQISIALDAFDRIRGFDGGCSCAEDECVFHIATNAIMKMKAIHEASIRG